MSRPKSLRGHSFVHRRVTENSVVSEMFGAEHWSPTTEGILRTYPVLSRCSDIFNSNDSGICTNIPEPRQFASEFRIALSKGHIKCRSGVNVIVRELAIGLMRLVHWERARAHLVYITLVSNDCQEIQDIISWQGNALLTAVDLANMAASAITNACSADVFVYIALLARNSKLSGEMETELRMANHAFSLVSVGSIFQRQEQEKFSMLGLIKRMPATPRNLAAGMCSLGNEEIAGKVILDIHAVALTAAIENLGGKRPDMTTMISASTMGDERGKEYIMQRLRSLNLIPSPEEFAMLVRDNFYTAMLSDELLSHLINGGVEPEPPTGRMMLHQASLPQEAEQYVEPNNVFMRSPSVMSVASNGSGSSLAATGGIAPMKRQRGSSKASHHELKRRKTVLNSVKGAKVATTHRAINMLFVEQTKMFNLGEDDLNAVMPDLVSMWHQRANIELHGTGTFANAIKLIVGMILMCIVGTDGGLIGTCSGSSKLFQIASLESKACGVQHEDLERVFKEAYTPHMLQVVAEIVKRYSGQTVSHNLSLVPLNGSPGSPDFSSETALLREKPDVEETFALFKAKYPIGAASLAGMVDNEDPYYSNAAKRVSMTGSAGELRFGIPSFSTMSAPTFTFGSTRTMN